MENDKPKSLHLQDCYFDWKHVEVEELDGTTTIEDQSADSQKILQSWIEEDCTCSEFGPANLEKCYLYFLYMNNYDRHKFAEYAEQHHHTKQNIAFWGFYAMINDGWLKSPAFVNWKEMGYCVSPFNASLHNLLMEINEPEKRVALLNYLIKNAEVVYGKWGKKEFTPMLKDMLETHKAAATVRKQELARQAAEERKKAKAKQPQPELVVSLDEIAEYVKDNPESAPSIRSMLYYMILHKEGWNKPAILKKIDAMGGKIVHNGDNIYGNKHVGPTIETVESGAVGIEERHE